jgi:hypothetical protein
MLTNCPTAHRAGATLIYLQFYGHRIAILGLHSAFPLLSPDLTPLDFTFERFKR